MKSFLLAGLVLLLLAAFSPASGPSASAFETLKGLQGKWAIESGGKTLPIQMTYDIGSKGSIVTEQFGKELSVFFHDGEGVAMIHFCNAGNQPRLRLVPTTRPDFLQFEMFDISNLKSPAADHVQRINYTFLNPNSIGLEIVWQRSQSQTSSEKYTLTRL